MPKLFLGLIYLFILPVKAYEECKKFYTPGVSVENYKGSLKIISTSELPLVLDDNFAEIIVTQEAKYEAKDNLIKYLQDPKSELCVDLRSKFISLSEEDIPTKENNILKVICNEKTNNLINLRGIKFSSSCIKKGEYVRATFEIGEESILRADKLREKINIKKNDNNLNEDFSNSYKSSELNGNNQNINNGFSNIERLSNF